MLYHIPSIVQKILPQLVWRQVHGSGVYLTFDDGPVPEATPFVLDLLAQYGAKATFFCVGENVERHPDIYKRIIEEGHAVGNHTHNHLNGWLTNTSSYINNTEKAAQHIDSRLFRPPYGKLKPAQYKALKSYYKVIMWDVLSMDYDRNVSATQCEQIVKQHTKLGSVVVFHDSVKAIEKLSIVLPKVLEHFQLLGWEMKSLELVNRQKEQQKI